MVLAGSHDTSPLDGLLRSVAVGLAALPVLVAALPPDRRPRLPGPVRRVLARPAGAVRQWWADGAAGPLR
jgi:hypothetical protein